MVDISILLIIAIVLIPVGFVLGVLSGVDSVRLGLKWQIQAKKEREPTYDEPKPKVDDKTPTPTQVTAEWLFGAKGDGR